MTGKILISRVLILSLIILLVLPTSNWVSRGLALFDLKILDFILSARKTNLNRLYSVWNRRIVLVTVTDADVSQFKLAYGPSWRAIDIRLIARLREIGASVIAVDARYIGPTPYDIDLADAIKRGGVVLAVPDNNANLLPSELQQAGKLGHIQFQPEIDGVIRRLRPILPSPVDQNGNRLNCNDVALALRIYLILKGLVLTQFADRPQCLMNQDFLNRRLSIGNARFVLDSDYALFLSPLDAESRFTKYSYQDVISFDNSKTVSPEVRRTLTGSIVIVGEALSYSRDKFVTLAGEMAGVELNALALATLLNGQDVIVPGTWYVSVLALVTAALSVVRWKWGGRGLLLAVIPTLGVGLLSLGYLRIWIRLTQILVIFFLVGFMTGFPVLRREAVRANFGYYAGTAALALSIMVGMLANNETWLTMGIGILIMLSLQRPRGSAT